MQENSKNKQLDVNYNGNTAEIQVVLPSSPGRDTIGDANTMIIFMESREMLVLDQSELSRADAESFFKVSEK
jgi:hypothetical protein